MADKTVRYVCPDSGKFYSAAEFQHSDFCYCCRVACRLIPETTTRDTHEESWADYADVAD